MTSVEDFGEDGALQNDFIKMVLPLAGEEDGFDAFPRPLPPELRETGDLPTGHLAFVGDYGEFAGYIMLLAGKPASGKTTISRMLIEAAARGEFQGVTVTHISAGDRLRDIGQGNTQSLYADEVASYTVKLKHAQPLPHSLVAQVIQEAVLESEETLVLLDGYPRFDEQLNDYQMLARHTGRKTIGLVEFIASDELVTERLLERGARTGEQNPNEALIKARLEEYHTSVARTIETIRRASIIEYRAIPVSGEVKEAAKDFSEFVRLKLAYDTII